jgi:hypothetical protein
LPPFAVDIGGYSGLLAAEERLSSSHEIAVTAPHQSLTFLDQTDNPGPQVVALPAPISEVVTFSQQHLVNCPISLAREPCILGTQLETKFAEASETIVRK